MLIDIMSVLHCTTAVTVTAVISEYHRGTEYKMTILVC